MSRMGAVRGFRRRRPALALALALAPALALGAPLKHAWAEVCAAPPLFPAAEACAAACAEGAHAAEQEERPPGGGADAAQAGAAEAGAGAQAGQGAGVQAAAASARGAPATSDAPSPAAGGAGGGEEGGGGEAGGEAGAEAGAPKKPRVGLEDFKRAKVEQVEQAKKRKEAASNSKGAEGAASTESALPGGSAGGAGEGGSSAAGGDDDAAKEAGSGGVGAAPPPPVAAALHKYSVPADDAGRVNYASSLNGAAVLGANADAKSPQALVTDNKDQYMIAPCSSSKWVVFELSAEVIVDTVVLYNYEVYSGTVRGFELWGSQVQAAPQDPRWAHLGTFEAAKSKQRQRFVLEGNEHWSRYLLLKLVSHHGTESYCTLTSVRVHGRDAIENLRHEMEGMSAEMEEFHALVHDQAAPEAKPGERDAANASAGRHAAEGADVTATLPEGGDAPAEARDEATTAAAEDEPISGGDAPLTSAHGSSDSEDPDEGASAGGTPDQPAKDGSGSSEGEASIGKAPAEVSAATSSSSNETVAAADGGAGLQSNAEDEHNEANTGSAAEADTNAANTLTEGSGAPAEGTVLGQLASALKGLVADTPAEVEGVSASNASDVAPAADDETAHAEEVDSNNRSDSDGDRNEAPAPSSGDALAINSVQTAGEKHGGSDPSPGQGGVPLGGVVARPAEASEADRVAPSAPPSPAAIAVLPSASLPASPTPTSVPPVSNGGGSSSSSPSSMPSPRSLSQGDHGHVFKALMTRIKNLEVNSSIFETYVEEFFLAQVEVDARCINATATLVASAEHYARMEAKRASEEARLREAVMLAAERRLTVLALEVARAESESARLALAAFVSALCACMAVAALVLQRVIGGGKALA